MPNYNHDHIANISICLISLLLWSVASQSRFIQAARQSYAQSRRVNVPYLSDRPFTPAIFWFGDISPTDNYTDVRIYYYDNELNVVLHIIDRHIWCDGSSDIQEVTDWDAVSLYLNLDGNLGAAPSANSYRFDAQVGCWGATQQTSFTGDGTAWVVESIPFNTESYWRGEGGPNSDTWDMGWEIRFHIPFSSLGLHSAPHQGTQWGLGLILHDRDDSEGTLIQHTNWPENMEADIPSSWGVMVFGLASYVAKPAIPKGMMTIRQGFNDASVVDAHVGGHTTCGEGLDYWNDWGNTNYAGYDQINIQNQWDIADWGCFSKYFVTFPLDALPTGYVIISATLNLYLFGNAGGGKLDKPPDSYIQVLTVGEAWDEATLTWNNAPLALENISGTWVHPKDYDSPDQAYYWDVSRAVAEAYTAGEPLRLALYSADGGQHTGKYFWSSDVDDWNAEERPTLRIQLGIPCDNSQANCNYAYIPLISK